MRYKFYINGVPASLEDGKRLKRDILLRRARVVRPYPVPGGWNWEVEA